jgi:hypothetical protein
VRGVVAQRAVLLLDLMDDVLQAGCCESGVVLDDERVPPTITLDPASPAVWDPTQGRHEGVRVLAGVARWVDRVEDASVIHRDLLELLHRRLKVVRLETAARSAFTESMHSGAHGLPLCALEFAGLFIARHVCDGAAGDLLAHLVFGSQPRARCPGS